jgi:MoaA/NifB/PqqE/SkfB family radical SAM enzyme
MYQKSLPKFNLSDNFSFKDMISKEKVFEIIDDLKDNGVPAVFFTGGGEPTLHPDILEIVEYVLYKGIELGMITNGAKISKDWLEVLKNPNFKWIRFSLDAATNDTWKKIHNPLTGNDLNQILNLVKYFKTNNSVTQIGATFVINDINWEEIEDFASLTKKYKFNSIRYSFTYQDKKEKFYYGIKNTILDTLKEVKKMSNKKFYISAQAERLNLLERKTRNYDNCYFIYLSTSIGADKKIYPCCMTKYSSKYVIGDLNNSSFAQEWKQINTFFKNLDVKKCPTCWYDRVNEMSEYYLLENPENKNFIN